MKVDIFKYISYQKLLVDELNERKKANSAYSSRAYSRDIGISNGMLSKVINYKKGLSLASAENIAVLLELNEEEKKYFIELVRTQAEDNEDLKLQSINYIFKHGSFNQRKELPDATLELLNDWYCLLVFCALDISKFQLAPELIAETLRVPVKKVLDTLSILLENDIITFENGKYLKLMESVVFKSDIPSANIQSFHRAQALKAQEMLFGSDIDDRFFQNINLPYDKRYKEEIRQKVTEFINEMSSYQKLGEPDSLMTVNANALFFDASEKPEVDI